MVTTIARVDVVEDAASFFGLHAAQEHASGAAFVELVVDDGVSAGASNHLPGLDLILWQLFGGEEVDVGEPPIGSLLSKGDQREFRWGRAGELDLRWMFDGRIVD